MTTRLRQFESASVFAAATAAFVLLDGAWWVYLLLALAPDLGMVGYRWNARVGSWTYNAAHVYTGPLALAGAAIATDTAFALQVAAVWTAHIGADRALGYGLKEPTGFEHTHLRSL